MQLKMLSFIYIKSVLRPFFKKQGLYCFQTSYTYGKIWTHTYMRNIKTAVKIISSNCLRLEIIVAL